VSRKKLDRVGVTEPDWSLSDEKMERIVTCPQLSNEASIEEPLFVLKRNTNTISLLLFVMVLFELFFLFGCIIPVLTTGNYSSMVFYDDVAQYKNIGLFYCALFSFLTTPFMFSDISRTGTFYFYKDRVTIDVFFKIKNKIETIYYYELNCILKKDGNESNKIELIIAKIELSKIRNILCLYKARYLDGFKLVLHFEPLTEKQTKIIKYAWFYDFKINDLLFFLKEKSASFVE